MLAPPVTDTAALGDDCRSPARNVRTLIGYTGRDRTGVRPQREALSTVVAAWESGDRLNRSRARDECNQRHVIDFC